MPSSYICANTGYGEACVDYGAIPVGVNGRDNTEGSGINLLTAISGDAGNHFLPTPFTPVLTPIALAQGQ
jgi:hypothetical protein